MKIFTKAIFAVLILATSTSVFAQEGKIEVKTVVEKETIVVDETGKQNIELVAAEKVVPGDVVIYTVTYTNVADEAVENIVITNPIGENLQYVADSAFAPGANVSFSVDGGSTFAELGELTVDTDGVTTAARAEDLTHIRWALDGVLDPGSRGFARFRARLN